MPRPVSDEEIVLKKRARRRLIGAIVLVTIVVVLLPMFLDSEPRPLNQEISIQIPAQSTEFSSRVAALPQSAAVDVEPARSDSKELEAPKSDPSEAGQRIPDSERTAPAEDKPGSEPERQVETLEPRDAGTDAATKPTPKTETKPSRKSETKPTAKSETKPASKPIGDAPREKESGREGYVVQVAALTDAEKAKRLKGRISESGLRAYTEVIKTARGEVTRVRVGPYASKEAAQKAADELKKLGFSGVVARRG
jgi:DedD protein